MKRLLSRFDPGSRRQTKLQPSLRPTIEELERRDVPSTYLDVVSEVQFTTGTFDGLYVTVNNTTYGVAGTQFAAKLASTIGALPGNSVPDFYSFCLDVGTDISVSNPYQATLSPASSFVPNGNAIAYLYNTFNSPVGTPLGKTQAAALQLAIWEEEYGTNIAGLDIVTPSDITSMDTYNGATETNAILSLAATYLSDVPSSPTSTATIYTPVVAGSTQCLIGPDPQIAVTKTADAASIVVGQTAGYTVTITNDGSMVDTDVTLSDLLPAGAGNNINWTIDTSGTGLGAGTVPADFQITGSAGSQSLGLSSSFISGGDSLAPGQSISVHYTGATNASDVGTSTNPALNVGGLANYAVLYEGTGTLSLGNDTVDGNIGVGSGGHAQFIGPVNVAGRLDFAAANSGQYHTSGSIVGPTSVNYDVSAVTTAINAVNSLSTALGSLAGTTIVFNNSNQTVNESSGTLETSNGVSYRVFNVTSYSEKNADTVTIVGDGSGDPVVFNFASNSNIDLGGKVALSGGLTADQVMWNFTSSGRQIDLDNNGGTFIGVILAPKDQYQSSDSNLYGRVFAGGCSLQIGCGSNIYVPITTGTLDNTATVSATGVITETASATITITAATVTSCRVGTAW